MRYAAFLPLLCVGAFPIEVQAQGKGAIIRESAEYVLGKFGREAAKEGIDGLTHKIELLILRHGDDAIIAVRKVGTGTFRLVEAAGDHGSSAVKLLAKYGDDAVWVVARKNRLAIFVKYGDDACEAMMKHGEVAEPLLETAGRPAASALKLVSTQNGRRLALMESSGNLARIGRTAEILETVGRFGDGAAEFIFTQKETLERPSAANAFLADPDSFISGSRNLDSTLPVAVAGLSRHWLVPSLCSWQGRCWALDCCCDGGGRRNAASRKQPWD